MITYQIEPWVSYRGGCDSLWKEHYEEVAGDKDRMPMRPDEMLYKTLENSGQLQIMVARETGIMLGYMIFVVKPHPHYADVLCGFEDAYFLTSSRRGVAGVKLIKESLEALKRRGVQRWFIHTKKAKDIGRVLEFLGGSHTDEIYSGWIGS